jgi:hypothetical protein
MGPSLECVSQYVYVCSVLSTLSLGVMLCAVVACRSSLLRSALSFFRSTSYRLIERERHTDRALGDTHHRKGGRKDGYDIASA